MIRWRGYEVRLDFDRVRFGGGEYNWVAPTPENGHPRPLRSAVVSRDGRWLTVAAHGYDFVFYDIGTTEAGGKWKWPIPVFEYRTRPQDRLVQWVREMSAGDRVVWS